MPKYKQRGPDLGLPCEPITLYNKVLVTALQSSTIPDRDRLAGALRARHYGSLLEWSERPSPQMYDTAESYFSEAQIAALIRKYPFSSDEIPGLDPESTAVKKFFAAEHRCKRENVRRRAKRKRWDPHAQFYAFARDYIEKVIGIRPDLTQLLSKCDFTEGASVGVHGNKTNAMRKLYAERWSVTPTALPYAMTALWLNVHTRGCILPGAVKCYDPDLFRGIVKSKVEKVGSNKISFVNKTAKTKRSIAVEPLLNGFVQKGADIYMREKLRNVGIDLSDQRVNQLLARSGSTTIANPFVTIDLSAASDSLATEVVRDLIPADWFEFLSDIRSPFYLLNNQTYRFEKFCSMGNGFCFPLQTLIFASVCHAAARVVDNAPFSEAKASFSVYGDDIIVKQNVALYVIEMLRDIGFKTNRDKTFITGPFRESCGSDWYNGQDVRPVHLDKPLTELREVFAFHNSTLRSQRCELFFEEVRSVLRLSAGGRYMRPGREPGDTCFSVPLDLAMASTGCTWNRVRQRFQWLEIVSYPVADPIARLGCDQRGDALMYAAMRGSSSSLPYAVRYSSTPRVKRILRPWKDDYVWTPGQHIVECVRGARKVAKVA